MKYNEIIRALREDHDLTQKEIANLLGTEQSYYAKYENGKHPLPIDHLINLCEYYKVSADYILGLPKGLSWPREESTRKEGQARKIYNPTKYIFLLRSRTSWALRAQDVLYRYRHHFQSLTEKRYRDKNRSTGYTGAPMLLVKQQYSCS